MKKIILGLMVVLGFGLSGCAVNAGNAKITKKENIRKLRVYKSSQAQVRQILGEPDSIMMLSGSKEKWIYRHTGGEHDMLGSFTNHGLLGIMRNGVGGGTNHTKTRMTLLTLIFNARGILVRKKFGY